MVGAIGNQTCRDLIYCQSLFVCPISIAGTTPVAGNGPANLDFNRTSSDLYFRMATTAVEDICMKFVMRIGPNSRTQTIEYQDLGSWHKI